MQEEKLSKSKVRMFEEYLDSMFEEKSWDEAQRSVDNETKRSIGYPIL